MMIGIWFPGYNLHVGEKQLQFIIILSVFVLQYLFEHIFPQNKEYNNLKNEVKNVGVGIFNITLLFIPAALLVEVLLFTKTKGLGLFQWIHLPILVNIIFTIIIMDVAMYWWHRLNHTRHFLWRFHRFHHYDKKMNTTTALRFHVVELLISSFFKALFFLMMGFSFSAVLIYETLFFIVVVIHHSNIRVSVNFDLWYRKLFSSPLMHRIHHSQIEEETNSNYGSVFSFWDKFFKTYKKDAAGEIVFGVAENRK